MLRTNQSDLSDQYIMPKFDRDHMLQIIGFPFPIFFISHSFTCYGTGKLVKQKSTRTFSWKRRTKLFLALY